MGQSWALDATPILGGDGYLCAGGETRMSLFVISVCSVKSSCKEPLYALRLVSVTLLCKGPGTYQYLLLSGPYAASRSLVRLAVCNWPALLEGELGPKDAHLCTLRGALW